MTFSDDSALIFSKTKSVAIKPNKTSIDYGSSHILVSRIVSWSIPCATLTKSLQPFKNHRLTIPPPICPLHKTVRSAIVMLADRIAVHGD